MDRGGYMPMRGVLYEPKTISQLTIFVPLNHVCYMYQPSEFSLVTIPTPPCMPLASVGTAFKHATSYPRPFSQ